jgi:multiple sugar transport system ATP-binding protein
MAEIVLEGIVKRYADGTEAVADTDLTIRDGELFILVGPSGCGKSTLLKLIVGLERPTRGRVQVGGKDVTGLDPKDRNMAMVFQSYAIYPHMSVRENMAFPLKLAKLSDDEITRRVEHAARILELTDFLERKPAALSGGQRQRVAMGRAIVRDPAAFLFDEPLSNLDAKLRAQMRTELARLQRRLGTTTVYVTHDQTEAMTLGERIAVLRNGRIQQIGTPRELYREPANLFVAGFIGSPAMNLLPARIDGDRLRLPMLELPLPEHLRDALPADQRRVIAGIRPEDFVQARSPSQAIEAAAGPDSGATGEAGAVGGDAAKPDADRSPDADARDAAGATAGTEARGGTEGPPSFQARIELLEWLGADLYLHFDIDVQSAGGTGSGDGAGSRDDGARGTGDSSASSVEGANGGGDSAGGIGKSDGSGSADGIGDKERNDSGRDRLDRDRNNFGRTLNALRRELDLDTEHDGKLRLIARIGPDGDLAEGDTVGLRLSPDTILLFDPETGERLAAQGRFRG